MLEPEERPRRSFIPAAFSASVVGQLLGAFACFLAAYVLPANYPELQGHTSTILVCGGAALLTIGLANLIIGSWMRRWLSRFGMRSRVVLPREGVVYLGIMLVIAVGALLGHSNMLLLVFGLMAGPFVVNGWIVMSMLHRVTVERHLPPSATAGEFFGVELRLSNGKRWLSSRLIEVRDVIQGAGTRAEATVTFVRVGPHKVRSGSYQIRMTRRGVYRLGPIRLSSRFPLGIGERGRASADFARLYVHPPIGQLRPGWQRRELVNASATSHRAFQRGIYDDELHNIREYRHGDNPRAIHWRTTARKGELMVREFEQQREAEVAVLLDLSRTPGVDEDTEELAVCLAATICHEQTRQTHAGEFRMLISGEESMDVRCPGGAAFRKAALDALSSCRFGAWVDLGPLAAAACRAASSAHGCCVIISPRPQEIWEAITAASQVTSPSGLTLHGHISVIPLDRSRILEMFEPAETSESRERREAQESASGVKVRQPHREAVPV